MTNTTDRAGAATAALSFPEMRHWFLSHWDPDNPAYYNPEALRLRGPLEIAALQASLDELVARHEALRTRFPIVDGSPARVVDDPAPVTLEFEDLGEVPEDEREAALSLRVAARASARFDLDAGPLFRAALLRVADDDHVFVMASHHVIADAWSVGVLCQELEVLYDGFASGSQPDLPSPVLRYSDFAKEQADRVSDDVFASDLAFWRARLAGAPPLELPTDGPRSAAGTKGGGARSFVIPLSTYKAVADVARSARSTPFIAFLAAFTALLSRLSGQDDISVGSPVAGRPRAEFQEVVGCFVNMVVFRSDASGDPTFRELLGRVRKTALETFSHQELPFEKLVFELQPQRDPSRHPLYQVILSMQPKTLRIPALRGLDVRRYPFEHLMSVTDITLTIDVTDDGAEGMVSFDAGLFDGPSVDRLIERFLRVLEGISDDPDAPISALPVLTADEQGALREWQSRVAAYPASAAIPELFEAQAVAHPDNEAVVDGNDRLTYAQLDERSNQLAHRLRAAGVGADSVVGVLLPRSVDAVVAVLGILKAGGAYLPLDPELPRRRLEFMLSDAGAKAVVSRRDIVSALADGALPTVLVDHLDRGADGGTTAPSVAIDPDNIAYVIYTSGSTGAPKGVAVPHRGVVRLVFGQDYTRFGPDRRVLLSHFAFDASTFELWSPLLHGGTVVVLPEQLPTPTDIRRVVTAERVNTVLLVTTLFNLIVDEDPFAFAGVDEVLVGGEALSARHVAAVQDALPGTTVVNVYGPTECTTFACCHRLPHGLSNDRPVPIGPPIGNTVVRLLDSSLQPVPLGVVGELFLGGPGMAREYIRRPALTAERFVPDAESDIPGARLYRTGDLGRWLPDGTVEFLGRFDQQVKLRGFRIELGEVEAALVAHPDVREAVVVTREERGRTHLVAYVVGRPGALLIPAVLRDHLQERLPGYMVPRAFVELETIPLTSNGKLDRTALPEPAPIGGGVPYEAPRDDRERVLADVWTRVLGVQRIGIWENFFDLGGDSIAAVQVTFLASDAGLGLSPRDVFEHQTIAELAAAAGAVAEHDEDAGDGGEPAGTEVPLTPIQRWMLESDVPDASHFNMSLLFEAAQMLEPDLFEQAVDIVLHGHDVFRLRFHRITGGWAQRYTHEEDRRWSGLEVVDIDGNTPHEREAALAETIERLHTSLNITDGPLFAAALVREQAGGDRVLVVAHHLVADAMSWQTLIADIQVAYRQLSVGTAVRLAPRPASFSSWARHLASLAEADELRAEADYWVQQAAVEPLFGDGLVAEPMAATRHLTFALTEAETESLFRGVVPTLGVTMQEALLTALALAVEQRSGRRLISVQLEGHGREPGPNGPDVSRTVGWLTAEYPLAISVPSGESLRGVLAAVAERVRSVPGHGLGYGLLRYLGPPETAEHLAKAGTPDIRFNYLGVFDRAFLDGGLLSRFLGTPGTLVCRDAARPFPVELDIGVVNGELTAIWRHTQATETEVRGWAMSFMTALRHILAEVDAAGQARPTPAEFPAAGLDQDRLDDLLARLSDEEAP